MKVILKRSPRPEKKWRVIFENGKKVDFGAKGMSDYTFHKNPARMRSYVDRHGAIIPESVKEEEDLDKIHKRMLQVRKSSKERWGRDGIYTAGFWSRWLTWSMPTIKGAKKLIEDRYELKFV